eukprot:Mrub_10473.p1 GENE.Mrub_10473~~Mrub_10473.p1  ORF type:complete len:178 (+),score=19.90 Mrub_10473:22-534(+)
MGKKGKKGPKNNKTAIPIYIPPELSKPKLKLKCICRESLTKSQLNAIELTVPTITRVGYVLNQINEKYMGILLNLTLNRRIKKDKVDDKVNDKVNDKDQFIYQTLDNFKTFEEQGIIKSEEEDGCVTLYYDFDQEKKVTRDFSLYGSETNGPLLRISHSFKKLFPEPSKN